MGGFYRSGYNRGVIQKSGCINDKACANGAGDSRYPAVNDDPLRIELTANRTCSTDCVQILHTPYYVVVRM
eukprot:scaffold894_cov130-Isochrysis_galbana.AAC.7